MLIIHLLPIPLRFPEETLTIKETITIINAVYIGAEEEGKTAPKGRPEASD
ncbi:hypothetical protein D3C80_1907590 [compost metagenome]